MIDDNRPGPVPRAAFTSNEIVTIDVPTVYSTVGPPRFTERARNRHERRTRGAAATRYFLPARRARPRARLRFAATLVAFATRARRWSGVRAASAAAAISLRCALDSGPVRGRAAS